MYLITCVLRKDLDQLTQTTSLGVQGLAKDPRFSTWGQRKFLSDCANVQADLSLQRTHMSEVIIPYLKFLCATAVSVHLVPIRSFSSNH